MASPEMYFCMNGSDIILKVVDGVPPNRLEQETMCDTCEVPWGNVWNGMVKSVSLGIKCSQNWRLQDKALQQVLEYGAGASLGFENLSKSLIAAKEAGAI